MAGLGEEGGEGWGGGHGGRGGGGGGKPVRGAEMQVEGLAESRDGWIWNNTGMPTEKGVMERGRDWPR